MKKLLALALALILTLSLCACGAENSICSTDTAAAYSGEIDYEAAVAEDFGLAAGDYSSGSTAPETDPAKIIYSADITVETTDFESSIAGLAELLEQYSGWVESSSISGTNYYRLSRGYSDSRYAEYSIRVPSESFDTLMSSFSGLGNVPYTYTYTENVTTQYYDTEARLNAYEAQEARLLEMMEQTDTVSDLIAIDDKLSDVRYQIESLQSTISNWDRQISYSTITLSIQEVSEYTPDTPQSFGQQLWQALLSGLSNTGLFFKELLLFIVGALPCIAILAVLFVLLRKPVKSKWENRKKLRPKSRKTLDIPAKISIIIRPVHDDRQSLLPL